VTMSKPWTMEDFADCMSTGPFRGEVGYIGDIEELREYPCNCVTCVTAGMEDDLEKTEYRLEVAEQKLADIWDILESRWTSEETLYLVRERMARK
jgi:hypothetical protein